MGLMVDSLSFRVPVASPMGRSVFNDMKRVLLVHRSGHCCVPDFCLKVVSMFRMCNIPYLSANMSYSWCIVCWE